MKPIFVVGAARSGSRIYLNLFNSHSVVDMIEEPHILNPWWLHRDFVRSTRKKIRDLRSDQSIETLVDLMFSKYYYGYFWESIKLDRVSLKERILATDRSIRAIFWAVMAESCETSGKSIPGAKYPVHVSYAFRLLSWFPECRIIHVMRDPRAFFASQIYKYARQSSFSDAVKRVALYAPMLVHAMLQFSWSAKVYGANRHLSNYYLSRYEDIVLDPEGSIRRLCDFVNIDFSSSMLSIPVVDSSHKIDDIGISRKSLESWKRRISRPSQKAIEVGTGSFMRRMGYQKCKNS